MPVSVPLGYRHSDAEPEVTNPSNTGDSRSRKHLLEELPAVRIVVRSLLIVISRCPCASRDLPILLCAAQRPLRSLRVLGVSAVNIVAKTLTAETQSTLSNAKN